MHCVDVRSELSLLPACLPFLSFCLITLLTSPSPFTLYHPSHHSLVLLSSISLFPFPCLPYSSINQTPSLLSIRPHLQLQPNSSPILHPLLTSTQLKPPFEPTHRPVPFPSSGRSSPKPPRRWTSGRVVGFGFRRERESCGSGRERDSEKRCIW